MTPPAATPARARAAPPAGRAHRLDSREKSPAIVCRSTPDAQGQGGLLCFDGRGRLWAGTSSSIKREIEAFIIETMRSTRCVCTLLPDPSRGESQGAMMGLPGICLIWIHSTVSMCAGPTVLPLCTRPWRCSPHLPPAACCRRRRGPGRSQSASGGPTCRCRCLDVAGRREPAVHCCGCRRSP